MRQKRVTDWPKKEYTYTIPDNKRTKITPLGENKNPNKTATRIKKAAQMNFSVYPISPGMFHITSSSGETYIIDMDAYTNGTFRPVCECDDYRYRAVEDGIDCKHIIYIRWCIRTEILPPPGDDPIDWLHEKLRNLKNKYADNSQIINKIEEMEENPYHIEYSKLLEQIQQLKE